MQRPHALSLATLPDDADTDGGPSHMEHTHSNAALPLLLLALADSPPGPSEEPSPPSSMAVCSGGEGSTAAGGEGAPTLLSSALAPPLSSMA